MSMNEKLEINLVGTAVLLFEVCKFREYVCVFAPCELQVNCKVGEKFVFVKDISCYLCPFNIFNVFYIACFKRLHALKRVFNHTSNECKHA